MNRFVTACALAGVGVLVFVVSAQAALTIATYRGDMGSMPVPSVLWLVSGGLFGLAALGRRANGP
jgi:hypothetical protein